jgi:hypothetical protein
MLHAAIVHNAAGRYHPVLFRPAPRPSDRTKLDRSTLGEIVSHHSLAHHTEGFSTRLDADAWVNGEPDRYRLSGVVLGWNGEGAFPIFSLNFVQLTEGIEPLQPG